VLDSLPSLWNRRGRRKTLIEKLKAQSRNQKGHAAYRVSDTSRTAPCPIDHVDVGRTSDDRRRNSPRAQSLVTLRRQSREILDRTPVEEVFIKKRFRKKKSH